MTNIETYNSYEFLVRSELIEVKNKVLQNLHTRIEKSPQYWIIGHPIDYGIKINNHDTEKIEAHNHFMRSLFPDLLNRTRCLLESIFENKCFFDNRFSLPGFHIFTIPGNSEIVPYFHHDRMQEFVSNVASDLKVMDISKTYSFTVWINEESEGIESGLYYFDHSNPMGEKSMRYVREKHHFFSEFAHLERYIPGKLNLHDCPVHSIFGKNNLLSDKQRITFQGHVIETSKGLLIYW